jgi:hypothetical protein
MAVSPDAINAALLLELRDLLRIANVSNDAVANELTALRKLQEPNTLHYLYELDMTKERTNEIIAEFTTEDINAITVIILPSDLTLHLNTIVSQPVKLLANESISITKYKITRIYATNVAGTGTAKIYVFGK